MAYLLSSARTSCTLFTMANTQRLLSVGDNVVCEGRVCYVQKIDNSLGYNSYHVVDWDSGVLLVKGRYQLELCETQFLSPADDPMPMAFDNATPTYMEKPKEEPDDTRFATVSESFLDEMELNRSSVKTKRQTAWAVKILKGESKM